MGIISGKTIEMKQKIITTRPEGKPVDNIVGVCFEIINIPVTKIVPKREIETGRIEEFGPTVGVFTSSRGAEIFLSLFPENHLPGMKAVAIGEKTAEVLSDKYDAVLVPEEKTSIGVNILLDDIITEKDRIALFSSAKSNGIILKHLQEKKWPHLLVELYDAEPIDIEPLLREFSKSDCFGILVTSSMEADAIFNERNGKCLPVQGLFGKHIFAIGKTTAETLHSIGVPVSSPIGASRIEGLLKDIELEYCSQK